MSNFLMSMIWCIIHDHIDIHCDHYTYKVFTTQHIPPSNVLIKCRRITKHVFLMIKQLKRKTLYNHELFQVLMNIEMMILDAK